MLNVPRYVDLLFIQHIASYLLQPFLTPTWKFLFLLSLIANATLISSGKNSTAGRNSSGYGDILQGYLEMSGVDMAEQFTDMIVATKAFQAAGKTITTGDEILSEIINLKR